MAESKRFSRQSRRFLRGRVVVVLSTTASWACSLTDFDPLTAGVSAGTEGVAGAGGSSSGGAGEGGEGGSSIGGGGAEPAEPDAGTTNLFFNGGFEEDPSIWVPMGSCVTRRVTDNPRSGTYCLSTTDRTATWEGPGYLLTGILEPGQPYQVAVWARSEVGSYPLTLTYKRRCTDDPADGIYTQLGTRAVTTAWTELTGVLVVPECPLLESMIYVEGAPVGESFSIDDTSLHLLL
jgi:hypothetical protein